MSIEREAVESMVDLQITRLHADITRLRGGAGNRTIEASAEGAAIIMRAESALAASLLAWASLYR